VDHAPPLCLTSSRATPGAPRRRRTSAAGPHVHAKATLATARSARGRAARGYFLLRRADVRVFDMEDQGVLIRSLGSKRALASLSTPNDADTKAPTRRTSQRDIRSNGPSANYHEAIASRYPNQPEQSGIIRSELDMTSRSRRRIGANHRQYRMYTP
jgi:hypothetical protein